MAALLKLLVLSICLNTFLYLGMNYAIYDGLPNNQKPVLQGDLFDVLMEDKQSFQASMDEYASSINNSESYNTSYTFSVASNFSNVPNPEAGSSVSSAAGGFGFLDGIRMIIAFVKTLWAIALMPIMLMTNNILPPFAAVIIGLPLLILNVTTLIVLIRGGGAV